MFRDAEAGAVLHRLDLGEVAVLVEDAPELGDAFAERVAEMGRILDEDGYLAEVEPMDDGTGFRITEHNCAILSVASKYGQACSSELEFIRAALPDATIDRVKHMMAGAYVCAYEVRPKG